MRTEPELRAMIRRLEEEAENTDRELQDALNDPTRGAPEAEILMRRWKGILGAKNALVWAAGDFTNDEFLSFVQERDRR